ncbi:hypothetical protein D3C79_769290 [compost metagenome]
MSHIFVPSDQTAIVSGVGGEGIVHVLDIGSEDIAVVAITHIGNSAAFAVSFLKVCLGGCARVLRRGAIAGVDKTLPEGTISGAASRQQLSDGETHHCIAKCYRIALGILHGEVHGQRLDLATVAIVHYHKVRCTGRKYHRSRLTLHRGRRIILVAVVAATTR